jgi:hypothetical protein
MRARAAIAVAAVIALVSVVLVGCLPPPPPPGPPLPSRMAAVGDSITTATDVAWCCVDPNGGNPQFSWSTGSSPLVNSHYRRVLAANGGQAVATLNAAQPGADSADLGAQLGAAAQFGADYVTVLMGGNDLCYGPTSVAVFQDRVNSGFDDFFAADPNARMFLSSIPNLYYLWQIEHTDPWAVLVWNVFGVCPNMLSAKLSESQRQETLALEVQFNTVLQNACAQHARCRWDNGATFEYPFTTEDVSPVDHYHPSLQGQNTLARVTWEASYWG